MRYMFFLFLVVVNLVCYGQIIFSKTPHVYENNDSVIYYLEDTLVFDNFKQKIHSDFNIFASQFIIPFDSTIKYGQPIFLQKAMISKKNKCGYLTITCYNRTLFRYEIRESQINGIGVAYFLFLNKPASIALFKNGEIDGPALICPMNEDIVQGIYVYKKGKFKKCIYHILSPSKKRLQKANRIIVDPFVMLDCPIKKLTDINFS